MALGGAFVGLADDATAALVNPAGLIELTRPEISVEGRYRRLTQPFLKGGRLSGIATGQGQDTVSGPIFDSISDSDISPAFVSFVAPRGRFRVAGFRSQLIRVDQEFNSQGAFQFRGFDTRDTALAATRSVTVDTYGASAAVETQRLWLGAGLLVQRFALRFQFDRFLHETFYGVPDPKQNLFQFSQSGDDIGVGAVVGLLIPLSDAKVGVSYKRAPRSQFSSFSGGLVGTQQRSTAEFKVPDTLAVGFSAALGDALLVTTEYTRVFHAQLRSDYVEVLAGQGESRDRINRFTVASAHEVHVGVEYLLPVARRPALRGGFWFDPDHSVRYQPTAANDLLDERISVSLSSGRDLWHVTFGTMIGIHPRVDVSAGVDRSARSTVISTSAIIRF